MTDYVTSTADAPMGRTGAIKLFDEPSFEGMRRAVRPAAEVLDMLVPHVVPGVETQALDEMIRDHIVRAGGVPATLGYRGYTPSSCISINHVISHGLPTTSEPRRVGQACSRPCRHRCPPP